MPVLLSTPLLKIPFLVGNAVFTYYGMTPPRQPPPPREQLQFAAPDLMTRTTHLQLAATAASKYVLCGAAIAEALVLLAPHLPQPYSSRILASLLLPPARTHAVAALHPTPLSVTACLLGIAGGMIRVWCHRTLGKLFTWQMALRDDHELVTRGPYAIVRHPSYTGWLFMIAGNFALLASPGSYFVESGLCGSVAGRVVVLASFAYCMFSTGNLMRRVAKEDKVLRKEFGAQWEAWAGRTRYRLIPFIY